MLICNKAHECDSPDCQHKKPHKGEFNDGKSCGPGMPCFPRKILSHCIPVVNGEYSSFERKWCPHCDGRGYTDIEHKHKVTEEE